MLCEQLAEMGIWVEMADARHLVLLCTPQDTPDVYKRQPVPIPNTEVKLRSAEDTWLETTWENR